MSQNQTEVSGSPISSVQASWQTHVAKIALAADQWAITRGQYDAKWEHKQHLVADATAAIVAAEGFPRSEHQAIAIVELAIDRVNFRLRLLGL